MLLGKRTRVSEGPGLACGGIVIDKSTSGWVDPALDLYLSLCLQCLTQGTEKGA